MKKLYKGLVKVLWFFVKLVGKAVVLTIKLVAPKAARGLQDRLNKTDRQLS